MSARPAPRWLVLAAFAAIYLIWGSTYLGIGLAVKTIPPHIMAGARFVVSGGILFAVLFARGERVPPLAYWRSALVIGVLLLGLGNGSVSWAEKTVPSGLAALLIAVVPLWMVLFEWLRPGGIRPRRGVFAGIGLGLVGMVLLIGPSSLGLDRPLDPFGLVILLSASISWSLGSIYARHARVPESPLMLTAMEMLTGGAFLLLMGLPLGEWQTFSPANVSTTSLVALVYLTLSGSLLGFTAYVYLLQVSTPAKVATYAYVNPVVAVFLGWALNGEQVSWLTLLASGIIVAAVALITYVQTRPRSRPASVLEIEPP